jgi:hypothetical protein
LLEEGLYFGDAETAWDTFDADDELGDFVKGIGAEGLVVLDRQLEADGISVIVWVGELG